MNALIATFKQMTWTARIGLLIILFYTFLALFGPLVAPFGETEIVDAIWTYPAPYAAVADVADHVAFYPDKAEITVG